jgi:P-type conjugative transfer protein TrbJ
LITDAKEKNMKKLVVKRLAAELALVLTFVATPHLTTPARATGLPVIDGANLSQNMVTAIENVAHTMKQIEQYRTQLQQYENMIQNTAAPSSYTWDQATITMNQLRGAIDTLSYYKQNLGSIDTYLGKFKSTAAYRGSPCFSGGGCTAAEWAAMTESQRLGSEAQLKATNGLFIGLDKQQDAIVADARQLERLQSSAQGANGQMQAIGFANQLASQQTNQLLQIRALLIAEQNVIATREKVVADREAQQAAAAEQLRRGEFRPSAVRNW